MLYSDISIDSSQSNYIIILRECYDKIFNKIISNNGEIKFSGYEFNNHIGDITKDIRWTWATNKKSIRLFENCVKKLKPDINRLFGNNFTIFGASFITLYVNEVKNSDFHIDVNSFYDVKTPNILTLIFPLYIDEDMGGLEYKVLEKTNKYKYKKNSVFVWDACKLLHRTQPYKLSSKKKRVLVSLNLVSSEEWAIQSIRNTLKYQGNMI
jgi:hypothetical protein